MKDKDNQPSKTAQLLQKKVDDGKDNALIDALIKAKTKGLSKDEAKAKLKNIVDEILES